VSTRMGKQSTPTSVMKNGPPLEATFLSPKSLLLLPDGRLVIADTSYQVLRVFTP